MVAVLLAVVVLARPAYVGVDFFMRGVGAIGQDLLFGKFCRGLRKI